MADFEYYDDFEDYDDFEYYNDIIQEVMYQKELYPRDIPKRTRRQGVRGYGQNECENCNRTWSSYRAHVVIDLKKQEVVKIYIQLCRWCEEESVPSFCEEEFTEMVEKAIEQERHYRYWNSNDRNVADDGGRRGPPGRPPHESALCEKCGYGEGRNCLER